MSPLDHAVGPWRINFALENWEQLSPDQRQLVTAEINWIFQHDMIAAADLKTRLPTVRNPYGRVVAELEMVLAPP